MTTIRSLSLLALLTATGAAVGCSSDTTGSEELDDTEWIAANSFEVNTRFKGTLTHAATGLYAELATDEVLQTEVIATHISYAKNDMKHAAYQVNLMPDEILSVNVSVEGELVTIAYEASVDMVRKAVYGVDVTTIADLPKTHFEVTIPADPVDVFARAGDSCASDYGSYTLTEYKYYYYFDADNAGCEIPMVTGTIDVVSVYPNPTVYPEYDRLLNDLGDGLKGFRAAILPNYGDDDPMGRFNIHRDALAELDIEPEVTTEYYRYTWTQEGATIVIDLFDPTEGYFANTFYEALSNYQFVFYNGHSNYGHQPFLSNVDAYSDDYQIITMHSCQSYAYYTSQVAAGKATADDPTGWVNADMAATGRSSYPSDSPDVMMVLLEGLMAGLTVVANNQNELAPSWQAIAKRMADVAPSILYGMAGVRNNAWQPTPATPTEGCTHPICETGGALDPTCDPCVSQIGQADSYCTESFWDALCVEQVETVCGQTCG